LPRDLADLKARITAAVKIIDAPMLTRVFGKNLNIVSLCAVSPVVHTSNISGCVKKKIGFSVAVKNSIKVGPLVFFVINVCNHGEHYETPCTLRTISFNIQKFCVQATTHLCVLCGSQKNQRLFPYTALTDCFYNRGRKCSLRGTDWVFKSERYSFVLKRLNGMLNESREG